MARGVSNMLGPGFRFHPTDEELVQFYLRRKITGKSFRFDHIAVIDVYKFEPWDLPCRSKLQTRDLEWYFFSALDRKYGNGSRTNRATEKGYWKTTGKDREVTHGVRTVGMKKTLVYHIGRAPKGTRTNWVMHEYKMTDDELARAGVAQGAFVLCRIFEKSGSGPKNGEKYGAPLVEEEWEEDDDKEVVAPLPAADDGFLNAVSSGAYVETDDLEKELNLSDTIGSAGFPSSNFYPGECSSQREQSQVVVREEQKQMASTFGNSGPQNGAEHYGVVKVGDNGELSYDENPLNLNDTFGGIDQYWDATENFLAVNDGLFLETNDLVIPNEANIPGADPSGIEMLEEYLVLPDEDILKYISFDPPQETESENPIPNQGLPFIQQNVEKETGDISVASKHDTEARSGDEASSKQNSEESKLVSGSTNPIIKQANKWLASIPAAPAFASEFPTKEIALGLHSAAESSNSAHVTTGMISITDITFRGNMDWTMGKIGGFNAIIPTGYSQPDVNSAALIPVSGLVSSKTTFVLSHGWIFVMGFSVLILSLSFKIGSIMYTGK